MEYSSIPLDKLGVPPEFGRYVDPKGPKEVRLLAARGLIPAPPKFLISLQYCLLADPESVIAGVAREGLKAYPDKVLETALDDRTHSKVLEFFAFNCAQNDKIVELLLLKRQLNDRSICYLAEVVGARHLDMISDNQERLLITPSLFEHIRKNPIATRSMLERVESFLRMCNALEDEPVPTPEKPAPVPEFVPPPPLEEEPLEFRHGYESEEDQFPEELVMERDPNASDEGAHEGDLFNKISKLAVGQKIKLAFFGNAQVRAILVRDRNRMVATAVMKSPRITEKEVATIARNRNVCDDVIREIARNKEWFKTYPIRLALVNNPKCPQAIGLRIIPHLNLQDIKLLSTNRNVPHAIMIMAKQSMANKTK